jgi:hypothetical protein
MEIIQISPDTLTAMHDSKLPITIFILNRSNELETKIINDYKNYTISNNGTNIDINFNHHGYKTTYYVSDEIFINRNKTNFYCLQNLSMLFNKSTEMQVLKDKIREYYNLNIIIE